MPPCTGAVNIWGLILPSTMAQESALAKLPLGVTRLDQRGLDRAAAAAASEEDGVSAPSRKRTARMLNRCARLVCMAFKSTVPLLSQL